MSPRAYSIEKRRAAADETRARVLAAARKLLSGKSATEPSMEAIAREAGVARLTIYYQFESRAGLMEALYDHLAQRGNMERIADVFHEADPVLALDRMVRTFVGFWASDPVVIRRLRAMSALDQEVAQGIHARDARRSHIARQILKRTAKAPAELSPAQRAAADLISLLTSFESYDALARAGYSEAQIATMLTHLVQCAASESHVPSRKATVRRRSAR